MAQDPVPVNTALLRTLFVSMAHSASWNYNFWIAFGQFFIIAY